MEIELPVFFVPEWAVAATCVAVWVCCGLVAARLVVCQLNHPKEDEGEVFGAFIFGPIVLVVILMYYVIRFLAYLVRPIVYPKRFRD